MIIAFHPDTIHLEDNTKYAQMFVRLIQDNPDVFFILVLPNLDAGNKDIIKVQTIPFRFFPPRPVIRKAGVCLSFELDSRKPIKSQDRFVSALQ